MADQKPRVPSMDDKDTPSPPVRTVAQYEADKRLGWNAPPWPTDEQRGLAIVKVDEK